MTKITLSSSSKTTSPRSCLRGTPVSKSVKTTCSSKRIGREVPEKPPRPLKESGPGTSDGPWTCALLITNEILPKDFHWDRLLLETGITMNMLPFIDQCDSRSYILIVAIPCLDLLSRKFHGSELIIDHDPLEPSEEYKRTLGTWAAKKRARDFTLDTAAQATRMRWGDGPVEYFQEVIRTAGLELEFERAILNWDIRASCLYIYIPGLPAYSVLNAKDETRKRFAQNLLFFCLGRFDHYDNSSVVEVLQHEKRDWLQRYLTANLPCEKREELKQTIILFRGFLELSGGTVDCRRHNFGEDYTTTHNANLCAEYLGVSGSRQFGHFDPKEMQRALSKSELFAKASDEVPNPVEWSLSMMAVVPVGFPEDFLNLPSQLLFGLGAREVKKIQCYFEQTYCRLPYLRKKENNMLLLLSWSPTYHGQTLQVLSGWIKTQESMKLYQRLIEDLRRQQRPDNFALTLAALLCRERLLPYKMDDTIDALRGSYLADFDAILKGQDTSNRRAVFEFMITSLQRVLSTFDHLDTSEETVRLLAEVLDGEEATTLGPMEDQYCQEKVRGQDHDRAVAEAIEALSKMVKSDWNADDDWTVITSLITTL